MLWSEGLENVLDGLPNFIPIYIKTHANNKDQEHKQENQNWHNMKETFWVATKLLWKEQFYFPLVNSSLMGSLKILLHLLFRILFQTWLYKSKQHL